MDIVYALVDVIYALTGLCGDEKNRGVGHIGKMLTYLASEIIDCRIVLFDRIPLVDDDYACFARVVRDSCDFFVLLGDTDRCVYHDKANVGSLDRHVCAENAVFFDVVVYLGLTADSCRVYKREFAE